MFSGANASFFSLSLKIAFWANKKKISQKVCSERQTSRQEADRQTWSDWQTDLRDRKVDMERLADRFRETERQTQRDRKPDMKRLADRLRETERQTWRDRKADMERQKDSHGETGRQT